MSEFWEYRSNTRPRCMWQNVRYTLHIVQRFWDRKEKDLSFWPATVWSRRQLFWGRKIATFSIQFEAQPYSLILFSEERLFKILRRKSCIKIYHPQIINFKWRCMQVPSRTCRLYTNFNLLKAHSTFDIPKILPGWAVCWCCVTHLGPRHI